MSDSLSSLSESYFSGVSIPISLTLLPSDILKVSPSMTLATIIYSFVISFFSIPGISFLLSVLSLNSQEIPEIINDKMKQILTKQFLILKLIKNVNYEIYRICFIL